MVALVSSFIFSSVSSSAIPVGFYKSASCIQHFLEFIIMINIADIIIPEFQSLFENVFLDFIQQLNDPILNGIRAYNFLGQSIAPG